MRSSPGIGKEKDVVKVDINNCRDVTEVLENIFYSRLFVCFCFFFSFLTKIKSKRISAIVQTEIAVRSNLSDTDWPWSFEICCLHINQSLKKFSSLIERFLVFVAWCDVHMKIFIVNLLKVICLIHEAINYRIKRVNHKIGLQ